MSKRDRYGEYNRQSQAPVVSVVSGLRIVCVVRDVPDVRALQPFPNIRRANAVS